MKDNELFELCKEVYEKTNLKPIDDNTVMLVKQPYVGRGKLIKYQQKTLKQVLNDYDGEMLDEKELFMPLYTSDYLLEKLLNICAVEFYKRSGGEIDLVWAIKAGEPDLISSDTPLKALLKLTLALHAAGELK